MLRCAKFAALIHLDLFSQKIAASLHTLAANAYAGTCDQPLHLCLPLAAEAAADGLFVIFCHAPGTAFLLCQ